MLRWCYAMNISFILRRFHSYDIWYWDISPTYYTLSWFVHCQSSPPSSDYSLSYPRPISTRKYPQKIARKVGCSGIGDVLSKLFNGPVFKAGVCLFRLKPAGYWSNKCWWCCQKLRSNQKTAFEQIKIQKFSNKDAGCNQDQSRTWAQMGLVNISCPSRPWNLAVILGIQFPPPPSIHTFLEKIVLLLKALLL